VILQRSKECRAVQIADAECRGFELIANNWAVREAVERLWRGCELCRSTPTPAVCAARRLAEMNFTFVVICTFSIVVCWNTMFIKGKFKHLVGLQSNQKSTTFNPLGWLGLQPPTSTNNHGGTHRTQHAAAENAAPQ
jgi:hypothetical protein